MARDYSKVSPRFWTGHTGRQIRGAGAEAQVVALYLVSSPAANMIGLYYQPLPTLCHETGVSREGASKALSRLRELGFAFYDDSEEVVWVPEMARHQVAETLKPADKQVPAIEKEAAKYRKSRYYAAFVEKYADAFCLKNLPSPEALRSPCEAPSKALRSQEQEHEQDQDTSSLRSEAAPSAGASAPPSPVVATLPCVGRGPSEYGVTEEQVAGWQEAFPGIDVLGEVRKARTWLEANQAKRKTHRGCPAFLVRWFSRAHDQGPRSGPAGRDGLRQNPARSPKVAVEPWEPAPPPPRPSFGFFSPWQDLAERVEAAGELSPMLQATLDGCELQSDHQVLTARPRSSDVAQALATYVPGLMREAAALGFELRVLEPSQAAAGGAA